MVLIGIFAFSCYKVVDLYFSGKNEETAFEELLSLVESGGADPVPSSDPAEPAAPAMLPQYKAIYDKNPDVIGWLTVPGTNINYPVMYTPEEPEHYLRLAFDGTYAISGTPFVGAGANVDSDCFIIYGHKMKNKTMFGQLDYYADRSFWSETPAFSFNTLYQEREYRVFAAFKGKILSEGESGFRYYDYPGDFDEARFDEFMASVEEAALYKTDVTPKYGDQILILSTCAYHAENGRFVVVAFRQR